MWATSSPYALPFLGLVNVQYKVHVGAYLVSTAGRLQRCDGCRPLSSIGQTHPRRAPVRTKGSTCILCSRRNMLHHRARREAKRREAAVGRTGLERHADLMSGEGRHNGLSACRGHGGTEMSLMFEQESQIDLRSHPGTHQPLDIYPQCPDVAGGGF